MRHLKREFMIASIIVLSIQPIRRQQNSLQTVKDIQHKNDVLRTMKPSHVVFDSISLG